MVAAVEANAEHFDRQFASRVQDVEARRSVSRLGDATAERRRHLAAVEAPARSVAEAAADRERTAFDMAGWAVRNAREPERSSAHRQHASQQPATQPLSLLHDWMVHAADRWAGARRQPGSREGDWAALVVHESASCYLYYAFMTEEDDRRLKPMWELHLQMQLAHLHTASALLQRYGRRDPQEVIGEGLPEPVSVRDDRPLPRVHEPDRPDRGPDVLELLIAHHARMNRLCERAAGTTAEKARTAFGDLAELITVHEVAEGQMIHPLARRLPPDDQLADRLLDEESRISDALSDAVRAAAHGHLDDVLGGLRDLLTVHARREEHDEFPRLRKSVPLREREEMGRAVRAAEAAAVAGAGPQDPASTDARTVARTADHVRDALAVFS
ncbi:hemerythrin domain-containing protein [Actinoplanes sp. NPDC048791]|uniref:hemerythrin domain-containing protein n=1 Tax=Actinoplanes sp. NPDC048791 TaxID=3154623 RepID=UPI0033D723C3